MAAKTTSRAAPGQRTGTRYVTLKRERVVLHRSSISSLGNEAAFNLIRPRG